MGRGVTKPLVGCSNYSALGVDIPCVGDQNTKYHGEGVDIPFLGGSILHG